MPNQFGMRIITTVSKLYDYFTAIIMNCSGHVLKASNQLIFINTQLPGAGLAFLQDVGMAADDQADAFSSIISA